MDSTETKLKTQAAELIAANKELAFQNGEKENRAAELIVANNDLIETKKKLIKVNRLYSFISHINKTITRNNNEQTLFNEACRIAIEQGEFKMAWIGIADIAHRKIKLVASSGTTERDIQMLSDKTYDVDGPTEKVLQGQDYYEISNTQKEDGISWNEYASARGFKSAISLPIKKGGKAIGTFDLYSTETNFFDADEIKMLMEVAGDIAFGLELFEKEKIQTSTQELLVQTDKRFRAMIEKSADMKTLSAADGEMLYCSPSVTHVLGYTTEEFTCKSAFDLIHQDDIPGYSEKRKEILKTPGKSFYSQNRFLHKNGSWIWCEGTVTNWLDEPGINALVSNFKDISERKTADQRQEFDNNNLNALINNTADLMWSVDRDFNLITSNLPFDEMCKVNFGSSIAKGKNVLLAAYTPEMLSHFKQLYERAFAGEAFIHTEHFDFPVEMWTEISYYPIRKGNEIIGTACHSRDITELKRNETKIKESELKLKEAQAIAQMGSWEIGMKDGINTWSDEVYRIYGIEPGEVQPTAEAFLSFIHPADRNFVKGEIENSFSTLTDSSFEFHFIRKNGEMRYGSTDARFEFDENKKPLRLFGVIKDITKQKQAEEEREKIIGDILQRNKDLEQFSYIVSHNLRAPIANIMGIADALKLNLAKAERKQIITDLSTSVNKLNNIILDINHILQTKRDANEKKEMVRFSEILADVQLSMGNMIEKEDVHFTVDFTAVNEMLTLKNYLYSIFFNLISNSIKFRQTFISPVIEITSNIVKNNTELVFKDNGLGIDLNRNGKEVFGLYKRFHHHVVEGKGMGLHMVKTQVEALGGKISIRSQLGKGTEFRIIFEN